MFKIRDIVLPNDYTDAELANALMATVAYTYGDHITDQGFDISTIPGEGETETGTTVAGVAVVCASPDATMFITDVTSGKMAIVPFSADELAYVNAHSDLMSDIAELLGYSDFIVYQYYPVDVGEEARAVWSSMNYQWGSNTTVMTLNHYTNNSHDKGIYIATGATKQMYNTVAIPGFGNGLAPNGVVRWSGTQVWTPLEFYLTDMQNVQDAARKAVARNAQSTDERFTAITQSYANIAELVGSLAVFGNTVKDVTQRYNNVAQYIRRP